MDPWDEKSEYCYRLVTALEDMRVETPLALPAPPAPPTPPALGFSSFSDMYCPWRAVDEQDSFVQAVWYHARSCQEIKENLRRPMPDFDLLHWMGNEASSEEEKTEKELEFEVEFEEESESESEEEPEEDSEVEPEEESESEDEEEPEEEIEGDGEMLEHSEYDEPLYF